MVFNHGLVELKGIEGKEFKVNLYYVYSFRLVFLCTLRLEIESKRHERNLYFKIDQTKSNPKLPSR